MRTLVKLTDAQKAARATRRVIRKIENAPPERCHPALCPLKLWDGSFGDPPKCRCGKCGEEERSIAIGQVGPQDLMEEGEFAFKEIIYDPQGSEWKRRIQR
jgi:hypothetical protein